MADGSYRLDELGWLQFQELCAAVVELETGVLESSWEGSADRSRDVRLTKSAFQLPAPVLASVVWLRPRIPRERRDDKLREAIEAARERSAAARAASVLLMTNTAELVGEKILGPLELSERLDVDPALRRRMPAVLGVTDIDRLIPEALAAASSVNLPAAEELARVFVATRPYRRAIASLERNRFVVLTGPPEVGKTAIAQMIALVQLTDGWEAHDCRHPDELFARYKRDAAQVFVADDAFGSTEYRPDTAERWARELDRVLARMDDRHWLVWTSRPAPLAAGLRRVHRERGLERFPDPGSVQIDASRLTVEEKALILFRHVRAADLRRRRREYVKSVGESVVAHRYFTPERIRRFALAMNRPRSDLDVISLDELLRVPTEAMRSSLEALEDEHRHLLVALLDAPAGWVSERELARALRRHHPGGLTRAPHQLIDRLADHFLRVSQGSVDWVHPSWRDLVIEDLASHPDKRRNFLRAAGIDGVTLALSVAGGAAGERELPLLKADEDWDVLTTRALELVRELDSEELARLLHALAEASLHPADLWSQREVAALARELLAAIAPRLGAPDAPVSLIEAWLRAAARARPAPEPPSFAHLWARLVPTPRFDDPSEVARADDWLTLASVLWRYRPRDLAELGFPTRYGDVLAALVDAGRTTPDDPVLSRALLRLARLAPSVPGLMPVLPKLEDEEQLPREGAWEPLPPTDVFSVASVLRDL